MTTMRSVRLYSIVMVLGCAQPVGAEPVFHRAENNEPVAIVQVIRTPQYTEVHLQTQEARPKACWASDGPNSPYLLAAGRRHRFVDGDNISNCPANQDYAAGDTMMLRFAPLDLQSREFSLVEGQGGENQMVDPKSSPGTSYWNFVRVKLK